MGTVVGDTGGRGTRAISKVYPVEKGLIAATTTQEGNKISLEAQKSRLIEKKDLID